MSSTPEGKPLRENLHKKGRRLLTEGRLTVTYVSSDELSIYARCKGDSGNEYILGHSPANGWFCPCEARGRCSHLEALQLVVTNPVTGGR